MNERIEQMYFILERGITISLPPETTKIIAEAASKDEPLPWEESQRLAQIEEDSIMKRRYPSAVDGQKYMESVDINWREELYTEAERIAAKIAQEMKRKGKERVAVLLFGSVAKNLVRNKSDKDPSNIDMAVMADFTEKDRLELYDFIRPDREEFQKNVGSNMGVHIQCWEKLRNGEYNTALNYIASSGRALSDPSGSWKELECEALKYVYEQRMKKKISNEIRGTKRFMGIQQSQTTKDIFFIQFLSQVTTQKAAIFV